MATEIFRKLVDICHMTCYYLFLVFCCELASGTVSLTCDRAQGDDSKHDSLTSCIKINVFSCLNICRVPGK